MKTSLKSFIGLTMLLGAEWSVAEPVIYEPFDYPAGPLNGASGGGEIGLEGAWKAANETTLADSGLSHGLLPTRGNCIGNLSVGQNRFGGTRAISASALNSKGLLNDGATLWFSVIAGVSDQANITNMRLGFLLGSTGFNHVRFSYCLDEEGATGLGILLGKCITSNGAIMAIQYRDGSAGGKEGVKDAVFDSGADSSVLNKVGTHALVVGRFDWGATADTLTLYIPDENLNPGEPHSSLTVNVDQASYDTISFKRGCSAVMDEIRFGASYADVIATAHAPAPQPSDNTTAPEPQNNPPIVANNPPKPTPEPTPPAPPTNTVPLLGRGETVLISDDFERGKGAWSFSGNASHYQHDGSSANHAKTGMGAAMLSNPASNDEEDATCLTISTPLLLESRGASKAYITFDYKWHESGVEEAKFIVEHSPDGGKSWDKLDAVFTSENPNGSSFLTINSGLSDESLIRFRRVINERMPMSYDVYLDNISISAER